MKKARKIIVYIATSADGYIARADGDVAWLNRPQPAGNYGMDSFFGSIDTILWGRKTYDFALQMGGVFGPGGYFRNAKHFVFSRHPPTTPAQDVEFVSAPISAFAKQLRASAGKDVWMMGGAGLIASFLDENALDEFIIHVIPIFIGEGIPLIEPRRREVSLKLLSSRRFPDGVVRHHYRVLQG